MTTKLTEKEQIFVEEYVKNGGHGTNAAKKAYKTKSTKNASSIATRTLHKPKVQDALPKELRKQNITLERALNPISKALAAKKKDLDGKTIDDIELQLKGSDRALKLLLPNKGEGSLNVNLNIDSASFGGEFVINGDEVDG